MLKLLLAGTVEFHRPNKKYSLAKMANLAHCNSMSGHDA